MLPALLLGFLPGEKNELYDWAQHLVAGLVFGIIFILTFLGGDWRRHWVIPFTGVAAGTIIAAVIWRQGLPNFQGIFALAGSMVGGGYWFSQWRKKPILIETVFVAIGSTLSLWALSQLSWWVPFSQTLATLNNRLWFLAITAAMVGCLCVWQRAAVGARLNRTFYLLDALMLVMLAAAVVRTTDLADSILAAHHWSVYVAPAEMVREGRSLLGQVPSQYGFLSMLVLAGLPASSCFEGLYWMQVVTLWLSGAVIYFVLRTWLSAWWWQLGAGLIVTICVAFFCGDISQLCGPMLYPSAGAVRFFWVHLLLGYLFWWHQMASLQATTRRVLWIGSVIWLLGVLWSVESALYVTAAWLPAASLLAMPANAENFSALGRLRALFAGISLVLRIVGLYLAGAVLLIGICYRLIYHGWPWGGAYLEYARAFSSGFGAMPIDPRGPVWSLLLLHAALLAALVSIDRRRHLVLIWAAWGAFWSVSTYYISRSHAGNISNLGSTFLLIIGLFIPVVKAGDRRGLVRPWAWIVVTTWMGAMLWLVVTNTPALKRQWTEYQVTPHVNRLLPAQAEAGQLLAQCQRTQPGFFSMIGINDFACVTIELTTPHPNWLPLRSLPLYGPLPIERREYYLDAYHHQPKPGWLLAPLQPLQMEAGLSWLFDYIDARYSVTTYLRNDHWQAWYYVPKSKFESGDVKNQMVSRFYGHKRGADQTLQFMRKLGGNVDSRLLATTAKFYDFAEGRSIIGVTADSAEMRVSFPSNRIETEMVLRRADGDAGGVLTADFVAYASPIDQPGVRFERWRGRIKLPADKKECSVTERIDGSGMHTFFKVEIPKEFSGRMVAGWRNLNVTDVTRDTDAPAWLSPTSEVAVPMDETALARLLPDNWRPTEAWMRRAQVGLHGIELSPGGEIWLKLNHSLAKLVGTSMAWAPAMSGKETEIHGLWYKGGRMFWYDQPWPKDQPVNIRPFQAVGAEVGGWLVIAADLNPARVPAVVRVTEVQEVK